MAEIGGTNRSGTPADIYTVLMAIAAIALGIAVGYVLIRHNDLFGTYNPFALETITHVAQAARAAIA